MDQVQADIASVAEKLYFLRVFPKSPAWVNYRLKRRTHPKAILYALQQCLQRKPVDPWPYCEIVIRKAEPKQNARDFEAAAEKDKVDFNSFVDALKAYISAKSVK